LQPLSRLPRQTCAHRQEPEPTLPEFLWQGTPEEGNQKTIQASRQNNERLNHRTKQQPKGNKQMKMENKMIKIAVISIGIASAIVTSGFAAQIGDTVQAVVTAPERVSVPGARISDAVPVEVTHITLDSGVWLISGQINTVAFGVPSVCVYWTGGNISLDEPSFESTGTALFQAEKTLGANPQRPLILVQRVVEVDNGQEVFLVAGNFSPSLDMQAWGFITALKVRNHVH
jgi:hypothetical protein